MAGDVGVLVHREQIHATDNPITIRPSGLSGITPKAVIAYCNGVDTADGSTGADATFCWGFTDGTNTYSTGVWEEDSQVSTDVRNITDTDGLIKLDDEDGTTVIDLTGASLVSGGLNLTPTTRTNRPTVTYVFFYGADLQVATGGVTGFRTGEGDGGGDTLAVTTGLSGSNLDNQIIFFINGDSGSTSGFRDVSVDAASGAGEKSVIGIGCAYRDGAAGAPDAQWGYAYATRNAAGSGRLAAVVSDSRVALGIDTNNLDEQYSISDISDATFTVQSHHSGARWSFAWLALETDTLKTWCGVEDSPTGTSWAVTNPAFEPQAAGTLVSQITTLDSYTNSNIEAYGATAADSSTQSAAGCSSDDGAGTSVCKHIRSDKFLDFLEDDGTQGWEQSGTGDFAFDSLGWDISNLTVGTATTRKWPCWAIEASAAVGFTLDADAGSYTLTGTAAGLEHDKTVVADGGSYTWTGTAAALEHDKILVAAGSSYTLTGTDATLEYSAEGDKTLDADAGSYTLTGTAAALEHDKVVEADGGSYTLTGTAADLLKGRTLAADAGSYVWTGTAAAFDRTYVVEADADSYAYTGTDATLTYSGAAPPAVDNSDPPITGGGHVMAEGRYPEHWKEWEEPQPKVAPPPIPPSFAELIAEAAAELSMPVPVPKPAPARPRSIKPKTTKPKAKVAPIRPKVDVSPEILAETAAPATPEQDLADLERLLKRLNRRTALLLLMKLLD